MRRFVFILILPFSSLLAQVKDLQGQESKDYKRISRRSQKAPANDSYSTYFLANYLTSTSTTELNKVRSIYVWMAYNITYDMKGFISDDLPDYQPKAVLKDKVAVCEGYARLFNELCSEAGLRSEIIRGYSKGYVYKEGDKFEVTNHAWNAVYIGNEWHLIDVTWSALRSNNSGLIRPFNDEYFLAPAEEFIQHHLPEIPAWQLLSKPITKEDFEENEIIISPGSFNYTDSITLLLEMEPSKKTISYQLKALQFNPDNDASNYNLGVEYRFRALDLRDGLAKILAFETAKIEQREQQANEELDKAIAYFNLIRPSSSYYPSTQKLLDGIDYERGVLSYEAAYRLIDIYNGFSEDKKKIMKDNYETDILNYLEKAGDAFALVPRQSLSYKEAQKYIEFYLINPFEEI